MDNEKEKLIGKTVVCQGVRATIAEVYDACYWNGKWDIEFRDTNGVYRSWKQEFDGGYIE